MAAEFTGTEPLTLEHQLGHLNCSRPEINTWLGQHAVRLQRDGTCATYVWCDGQAPWVYGFYTLRPHRLRPDVPPENVSGYSGGELSGFLIAKLGIHKDLVSESRQITGRDETFELPVPIAVLIDALVDMAHAARIGGGRYAFIDAANEPEYLISALASLGFKPVNEAGSTLQFLKLSRSEPSIGD